MLLKGCPDHASMLKRLGFVLNGMQACSCIVGYVLGDKNGMWSCCLAERQLRKLYALAILCNAGIPGGAGSYLYTQ